jgi:triacylglycerol lipase
VSEVHRVYLVPGMFGFGRLAGYDYFEHIERLLVKRFEAAGIRYLVEVVPTPPTASIRRRARRVAEQVSNTAGDDNGPIHLVGHSTGGLDARLIASPTVSLELDQERLAWKPRLRSVVTINSPHYGTPLASFFTTVSGTRLLYALSLLTFTTLRYGGAPLAVFSGLIAALGTIDDAVGVDIKLLDRTTNLLLRFVDARGRDEVRDWLDGVRRDQGGIIQVTPEAMDIFNAATEDADGVGYASLASASPPPAPIRLMTRVRSPAQALSATIYATVHSVTSRENANYPCPRGEDDTRRILEAGLGRQVDNAVTDGIVPTLSMIWGQLLWAGKADHLDIVGHFHDDRASDHVDWLASGAHFDRIAFAEAIDALSTFLLREEG